MGAPRHLTVTQTQLARKGDYQFIARWAQHVPLEHTTARNGAELLAAEQAGTLHTLSDVERFRLERERRRASPPHQHRQEDANA